MTRSKLNNDYFEWMYKLVYIRHPGQRTYRKLLMYLHNTEFTYTISMDGNRAGDGIDLRYRFGFENDISENLIAEYLDDKPCSVLEMMIALAIRCEEHIMDDPDIGDRTSKWFWDMIKNLGLYSMDYESFDKDYIFNVVSRFLDRKYKRNGEGGLFTIRNCDRDLRFMEIWYQAMWYLDEVLKN